MNGIDRHLGVVGKHLKQIKLTFTFISLMILLAISSIALVANAQEETPEDATVETTADEVQPDTERRSSAPGNATASGRSTAPEATPAVRQEADQETIQQVVRSALSERSQERIKNLAANISNRMEATIVRLETITGRLESRLNDITDNQSEIDLAAAQAELNTAKTSLQAAQSALNNIDNQVADTIGSESPQAAWLKAKVSYQATKQNIVSAHTSLKAAVNETRQALNQPNIPVGATETDEAEAAAE